MQVVRRGTGEVAMTEGELARFFGVTWKKVSGSLRAITEESILSPDERNAGERKIVTDKEVRGYAPLYPLPTIIALSFQLDCVEAHLFRRYVCSELSVVAYVCYYDMTTYYQQVNGKNMFLLTIE